MVSLKNCWSHVSWQGDAIELADITAGHFVFLVGWHSLEDAVKNLL